MKKIFTLVLTFLLLSTTVISAGRINFIDSPAPSSWVYENFQILNDAGLLRGYPDNTFKGYENASRYEMVMLTARIFTSLEEKIESNFNEDKEYIELEEIK